MRALAVLLCGALAWTSCPGLAAAGGIVRANPGSGVSGGIRVVGPAVVPQVANVISSLHASLSPSLAPSPGMAMATQRPSPSSRWLQAADYLRTEISAASLVPGPASEARAEAARAVLAALRGGRSAWRAFAAELAATDPPGEPGQGAAVAREAEVFFLEHGRELSRHGRKALMGLDPLLDGRVVFDGGASGVTATEPDASPVDATVPAFARPSGLSPSVPGAAPGRAAPAVDALPAAGSAPTARKGGVKRIVNRVVTGASLALFAALIWSIGPGVIAAQFSQMGWLLPLIFLPNIVTTAADGMSLWASIPKGSRASTRLREVMMVRPATQATLVALPSYLRLGVAEALRARFLRMAGVDAEGAVAAVVVAKTAQTAGQFLFLSFGLAVSVLLFDIPSVLLWMGAGIMGLAALGVAALFLILKFGALGRVLEGIRRVPFLRPLAERFAEAAGRIDMLLRDVLREGRGRLLAATAWSALFWLSGALEAWTILAVLGQPVSLLTAVAVYTLWIVIANATGFIPGLTEAAASEGLRGVGLSPALGAVFALLQRLITVGWAGIGFLLAARLAARERELERASSPPQSSRR